MIDDGRDANSAFVEPSVSVPTPAPDDWSNIEVRDLSLSEHNIFDHVIFEFVDGLQVGDVAILHPGERVSDGTTIQPR